MGGGEGEGLEEGEEKGKKDRAYRVCNVHGHYTDAVIPVADPRCRATTRRRRRRRRR